MIAVSCCGCNIINALRDIMVIGTKVAVLDCGNLRGHGSGSFVAVRTTVEDALTGFH